uniref:Exostosin GT47 domain-containing protein n=1 Tax=Chaetoceros debilis TaxID=122233 RepID=A0A7S3Q7G8_9STRA
MGSFERSLLASVTIIFLFAAFMNGFQISRVSVNLMDNDNYELSMDEAEAEVKVNVHKDSDTKAGFPVTESLSASVSSNGSDANLDRKDDKEAPEMQEGKEPNENSPEEEDSQKEKETTTTSTSDNNTSSSSSISSSNISKNIATEEDENCIFKDSPLYRSIYVYPIPGTDEWNNDKVDILSEFGKENKHNITYPWVDMQNKLLSEGKGLYVENNPLWNQYTTELLLQSIITHPDSCLRSYDPESASLFYVPYLASVEYHNESLYGGNYDITAQGQALMNVIANQNYTEWEHKFGHTSKYWERRGGSDHILSFGEPMHGLWHPRSRRGNFHFIRSQYQLHSPIVVSVELSTTFVSMYPKCARTNILMPYPNTDGNWFNGNHHQESLKVFAKAGFGDVTDSDAALAAEQELYITKFIKKEEEGNSGKAKSMNTDMDMDMATLEDIRSQPRPLAQAYGAGLHGECESLRRVLKKNYHCTPSQKLQWKLEDTKFQHTYHQGTFCPAPGGDSPSAKRMYDALHAGCIPVILSKDFVWPFSSEFDIEKESPTATSSYIQPDDFSIRLNATDYMVLRYIDNGRCKEQNETHPIGDIQSFLEGLPKEIIQRLREGGRRASDTYAYFKRRKDLPAFPLREGVLPDGGAAHALVAALAERANGALWGDCEAELKTFKNSPTKGDSVRRFKC